MVSEVFIGVLSIGLLGLFEIVGYCLFSLISFNEVFRPFTPVLFLLIVL